ncbi:fanconi-associated nuclease 1 [Entomortierella parvispora]|uniref:Fanconi-associated nuclease n=1 Tax=Entomortierella parvispora TaxID=205924 RepID=A0A9P3H2Y2_9FUNG|nr:fanconi-associated nuclease 1 [Entomortierella parvispora]
MRNKSASKAKGPRAKATAASGTTMTTGGKRQMPLDFSRHGVNVKKSSPSPDSATKNDNHASCLDHWRPSSSTAPPTIHVNLVSRTLSETFSGNGAVAVGAGSDISFTTILETSIDEGGNFDSTNGDSEENSDRNDVNNGEEDDGDDLVHFSRRIRPEDIQDEGGAEGDESEKDPTGTKIKSEEGIDEQGAIKIKREPEGDGEEPALDVILPTEYRWKTVYVAAFELALDTVLPEESFLFTDEEHTLFETYRSLPDDPKHLFVRLFLRRQKFWFRQSKLEGRYREIEDLESALQQLINVGLLMDRNSLQDPEEALAMLTMDELKLLARRTGIKESLSGKQRQALMSMISEHFRQQSFISRRLLLAPGGDPNGGREGEARKAGLATHIFSGNASKRDRALVDKITNISGQCVKIYPEVAKVFERLHLVFYRTREYSDRPALLEAILAKIGQRTFPNYEITRTNTVFKNRSELLKYEEAIKLHFELSELVESAMGPGRGATIYVRDADNDGVASGRISKQSNAMTEAETERRRAEVISIYEKVIQAAEGVRDAWRDYIATEEEVSKQNPNYFLLRFSPGWVYTQILRLELRAFAFLKRFEEESVLLHELLDQHIYSLGQRGGWYDRLALVKSNYAFQKRMGKQEALQVCMTALRDKHVHAVDATLLQARIVRLESELKVAFRERHDFSYLALKTAQKRILTGERLNTPGTVAPSYASSHSYSYVPSSMGPSHPTALQRPLWRNIDGSDCGVEELALSYYGTLGYKGYHSENSILATLFGLLFWDILFLPQPGVFETSYQSEPLDLRTDAFFLQRQDVIMERIDRIAGSALLENPDSMVVPSTTSKKKIKIESSFDEPRPIAVQRKADEKLLDNMLFEEEIIQELEDEDSEERLIRQVYDEYLVRKRQECFYLDLIQKHDDLHRPKKVFCVGVNWVFKKEELLEIAECIGASALSEICKIMAQEYSKRCSGMPDLCCWNYEKKLVKFVEVKGPGDRLSSKQQVWIDLLCSLKVDIELCIVQVSKDEDHFLQEREALN